MCLFTSFESSKVISTYSSKLNAFGSLLFIHSEHHRHHHFHSLFLPFLPFIPSTLQLDSLPISHPLLSEHLYTAAYQKLQPFLTNRLLLPRNAPWPPVLFSTTLLPYTSPLHCLENPDIHQYMVLAQLTLIEQLKHYYYTYYSVACLLVGLMILHLCELCEERQQ